MCAAVMPLHQCSSLFQKVICGADGQLWYLVELSREIDRMSVFCVWVRVCGVRGEVQERAGVVRTDRCSGVESP